MNKEDKVTFDALIKLAEFSIALFDQRRNHSQKLALGFWAAIIGSAALLDSDSADLPLRTLVGAGAIIVLLHNYWLAQVFKADKKDKLIAFRAKDRAIELLAEGIQTPELEIADRSWYQDWSVRFQLLTTILLVVIIVIYVNQSRIQTTKALKSEVPPLLVVAQRRYFMHHLEAHF